MNSELLFRRNNRSLLREVPSNRWQTSPYVIEDDDCSICTGTSDRTHKINNLLPTATATLKGYFREVLSADGRDLDRVITVMLTDADLFRDVVATDVVSRAFDLLKDEVHCAGEDLNSALENIKAEAIREHEANESLPSDRAPGNRAPSDRAVILIEGSTASSSLTPSVDAPNSGESVLAVVEMPTTQADVASEGSADAMSAVTLSMGTPATASTTKSGERRA